MNLDIIKNLLKKFLRIFNLSLTKYDFYESLKKDQKTLEDLRVLCNINDKDYQKKVDLIKKSNSELKQDFFVLSMLNFKKSGYFVEFGSCDGLKLSNTFLLEKEFNWNGILAEPAKHWHQELKKNRKCNIETDCIWKVTGSKLIFKESELALYSTIKDLSDKDLHKDLRKRGKTYEVITISLNDLLEKYNAPKYIDYLSIDTEGSEYEVLQNFNFEKYDIKIITCEHNYTEFRSKIFNLLTKKGYKRIYQDLSKHDDWYVKSNKY